MHLNCRKFAIFSVSTSLLLGACKEKIDSEAESPSRSTNISELHAPKINYKDQWLNSKFDAKGIMAELINHPNPTNFSANYDFTKPPTVDLIKSAVIDIERLHTDLNVVGPIVAEFITKYNQELSLMTGNPIADSQKITNRLLANPEYSAKLQSAFRGQDLECFALASVYASSLLMIDSNVGTISLMSGIYYGKTADGRDYSQSGIAHAWVSIRQPNGEFENLCPSLSISDKPVYLKSKGESSDVLPVVGVTINRVPKQLIEVFLN